MEIAGQAKGTSPIATCQSVPGITSKYRLHCPVSLTNISEFPVLENQEIKLLAKFDELLDESWGVVRHKIDVCLARSRARATTKTKTRMESKVRN